MADRWECSQATGPSAWRHQDLSTSQPLGHTVSRALKQTNLYLGTGPGWTLCIGMYTATQGALVFDSVVDHNTQHTDAHILESRKISNKRGNRRVNTLWTERQTTPRLGEGICRRVDRKTPDFRPYIVCRHTHRLVWIPQVPWDQTTHSKIAMPMTAAPVAQRRMGLKASIWDNEGEAMHTGGCGRPSLPGKRQQENAYGQCLP